MAQLPTWRFRTMDEDQKHVEPTHREHLAPGGTVEPLVREAIQNSLDVTTEGKPTRITFSLGSVSPSVARPYFDALRPHVESVARSLPDGLPRSDDDIRFLAIEDYNTSGLIGDPLLRSDRNADGSKNHFFRFWHKVGPAVEVKRRGSWGVGKVVFSNASQIRTFFGLTLREGDANPLLLGEAGLTIHPLDGEVYDWYGYYADHQRHDSHYTLQPIKDPAASAFASAFLLNRSSCGLSIVVPYIRDEVKLNKLACAAIEQYFLPILAGRLEVTAREGSETLHITRSTIDEMVQRLTWPSSGPSSQQEVSTLLRLARWQVGLSPDDYTALPILGSDGHYMLRRDRISRDILDRLSDRFASSQRIALSLPVLIRARGGVAEEEEVRVVLERDESLRASNVPHLRSGINISKMRSQGPPGVRGIFIVGTEPEQGPLDKLLQASEGPAHINWEQQGEGYDKAKSLYDDAHKVISFARHLVRNLVELLSSPHDERDKRTLSAFFPDFSDAGNASGGSPGSRRGRRGNAATAPPPIPPGVVDGVIQSLAPLLRGLRPVDAAKVSIYPIDDPNAIQTVTTGQDGRFRFEHLGSGNFEITASKLGVGVAAREVNVPPQAGAYVELILRPTATPKMFRKIRLENGFAIRGDADYQGAMQPMRVRLAYAAWGGSKSYSEADFNLKDDSILVAFAGLKETDRGSVVVKPNVLRFTPIARDFSIEVRGFDVNRALYVDARVIDDAPADGGEE